MSKKPIIDNMNNLLWSGKINIPDAADQCGFTWKEMRMVHTEYCKHRNPSYTKENNFMLKLY